MKTILSFLLLLPLVSYTQDLKEHLWKDRLIIILADSYQHPKLIQQIKEFTNKTAALTDRKLIIYQVIPTSYYRGIKKKNEIKDNTLYIKYNPTTSFKILLIGLDGGRKLESTRVIPASQIFDQIDQMPMRMQEIKLKN
ncbi:DUF4174 domain-containing protein [Aquimarina litoralis]|uniref:DUF4174 domain-containing protein n=1 Tax=Aquimarina litoralis TaxID=584605 RepID=UPI001C585B20|nr:DUF4174 domain-containing protein [Aquimarina litoralis]MBW1298660.1 DUF4174 domain-containing protein [Aquimarina litoralis]